MSLSIVGGARTGQFARRALLADSALWVVGVPFAVWLRYDFDIGRIGGGTGAAIMAAVGLQAIVGLADGQYRSKWRYGTFAEARIVALSAAVVGITMTGTRIAPENAHAASSSWVPVKARNSCCGRSCRSKVAHRSKTAT